MTSVITGDIINSRELPDPEKWISALKSLLEKEGNSPQMWELYRGDSFQLEVRRPDEVLLTAIRIKAELKSIKHMDVRMGIGVGEKNYDASRITEANGQAFIYSGDQFEKLKKEKLTLAIKTPWIDFDTEINVSIKLALIAMDNWKPKTAEIVKISLEHPEAGQNELAELLNINQSSVSEGQKRAHFSEIMEFEKLFREKIRSITNIK